MDRNPTRVLIAGGGVAALEALIALRNIAEDRVAIELLTPTAEFAYRPLAVAEPFGLGEVKRYDVVELARDHGAAIHLAGLQRVDASARRILTWDGRTLDYDVLLVAVGAQPTTSIPGSITIKGQGFTRRFRTLLHELEEGAVGRVVFAVPPGASWPLPVYELALMTADFAARRGLSGVQLSLVTPEDSPLALFGAAASRAARALLDDHGIELRSGRYPAQFRAGRLSLVPSGDVPAERVVSLPRLGGPRLAGLPADAERFIPVDLHGRVAGERDVYAAGDATNCPIKQGGVATQQADAAAEAIAAAVGAPVDPAPFRPVLRGLLLTGSTPRYMRAEIAGGRGEDWAISEQPLWWPPSKIAGRWLAPYLALRNQELEAPAAGLPVHVEVGTPGLTRRAFAVRRAGETLALPMRS